MNSFWGGIEDGRWCQVCDGFFRGVMCVAWGNEHGVPVHGYEVLANQGVLQRGMISEILR